MQPHSPLPNESFNLTKVEAATDRKFCVPIRKAAAIFASLLIATAAILPHPAPAGDVGEAYFTIIPSDKSEATERVSNILKDCIDANRPTTTCVGLTLAECRTTLEQCTYLETNGWMAVGELLSQKLLALEALDERAFSTIQELWNRFVKADCAFIQDAYSSNTMVARGETAQCFLAHTASRTLALHRLFLNLQE